MDYKLELVLIPVSDVDRAKKFYLEQAGFVLIVDTSIGADMRVVQAVPPGSECAIGFGTGLTSAAPGAAQGLHLVVSDILAARAELTERGVSVSEVRHLENGTWVDGPAPGTRELRVVRRLHRPGRQHLDPAGSRPEQRPGMEPD